MSIDYTQSDFSNLADKTFIGFRPEVSTGGLTVEIINDGVTPVVLPQDGYIDQTDYVNWIWTNDTVKYQWGERGHLHMVIK